MSVSAGEKAGVPGAREIAERLVRARQNGRGLPGFPGPLPADMTAAYAVQEAGIALTGDAIVGWKVGRAGEQRLSGPVFGKLLRYARGPERIAFNVFEGGFAAIEAEFVIKVGKDAPPGRTNWSEAEALDMVGALHIGIETAGSPIPAINDIGSAAVISDFGNNSGLIVGPEISNWRARAPASLRCETFIDGRSVGRGTMAAMSAGGPLGALRFLLEHCARRERPLTAGMFVSTGAATGVHEITAGQSGCVDFGEDGKIECVAMAKGT